MGHYFMDTQYIRLYKRACARYIKAPWLYNHFDTDNDTINSEFPSHPIIIILTSRGTKILIIFEILALLIVFDSN